LDHLVRCVDDGLDDVTEPSRTVVNRHRVMLCIMVNDEARSAGVAAAREMEAYVRRFAVA